MKAINRTNQFQQITGIINSLVDAAEKWKIDTALAKSGIPILQAIIAWNDWRTSRKAHKNIPNLVIEELREAYGIDVPDNVNRQEAETILLKAGIEQPEQAYEIILRRLTARISQPDLVEYLGSAFDEISVHLSKLITASCSKYYLRRLEELLAFYPVCEDEKTPRWFRRTGPIAADFEGGTVIRRDADMISLRESIVKNTVTVLVGDEASGKSVMARQLGLECRRQSDFIEIYMLELGAHEQIDLPVLAGEISDIQGLVIIDDAHLNPRLISSLYNKLKRSRTIHTLIVTRPSLWGALNQRYDTLGDKSIRDSAMRLGSSNIAEVIAKQFSSEFGLADWQAEAIAAYSKKSKGHLWLLSYALEGALTSGDSGDVNSWIAEGVRLDLQWMERKMEGSNPDFPEICVAISPFYIHEIPVAEPFLAKSLGYKVGTLNKLCQIGAILRIEKDDDIFYALPHSAIAQAYWNSAGIYRKRLGFQNKEDVYYQYAASKVSNGLMLIMSLELGKCLMVLERIERDDNLLALIEMEESADAITKWIASDLADQMISDINNEEKKENFYRVLTRKIEEANAIDATLIFCAIADALYLDPALEELDAADLAQKISALEDVDGLLKCLRQLMDIPQYNEPVLEEVDASQIMKTLSNHDDLDDLQDIVDHLVSYLGYSIVEELDPDKLVRLFLDDWIPLSTVSSFIDWAIEHDETFGKELVTAVDKDERYKKLCGKVTSVQWISDAAKFIDLMNLHSDYDWEWFSLLDKEALVELMESEDEETGLDLFERMCSRGVVVVSEVRDFIGLIRIQELRELCEQFVNDIFGE